MLAIFILLRSALALEPPVGWTAVSPTRAVLDPAAPERGDLRELRVLGGSCDPDEFVLALRAAGFEPSAWSRTAEGDIQVDLAGALARGRCRADDAGATWMAVLAGVEAAGGLDPVALLTAITPDRGVSWGGDAAVLPAGGDNPNPWGAAAAASGDQGWWTERPDDAWRTPAELVGTWEGTILLAGQPTRLRLRLEASGAATLERKGAAGPETFEGSWATRKRWMRLDVPGGGAALDWRLLGSTLVLEYEGVDVTFHRMEPRR